MSSYEGDREWSDQWIPRIKAIVGPYLLGIACHEQDTKEATDLVVLLANNRRIAARVRRPGYAETYPYDFTIRSWRDTHTKTEHAKILEGFGDWLFFGHATPDGRAIYPWRLLDLQVFRGNILDLRVVKVPEDISNHDGTYFKAYDVRDFNPRLIIGSSGLGKLRVVA